MMFAFHHNIKHSTNERFVDVSMKEIRHRIYEDHSWSAPLPRQVQRFCAQSQCKSVGKSFREAMSDSLGVATFTPGRDFCTSDARVPRRLSPLDSGLTSGHCREVWGRRFEKYRKFSCTTEWLYMRFCRRPRRLQNLK